jgi:hypothetical protein
VTRPYDDMVESYTDMVGPYADVAGMSWWIVDSWMVKSFLDMWHLWRMDW